MSGVNATVAGIKGALKFQVRARVLADGGTVSATSNSVSVTNADSATILIALATSYKSFDDVSGDPEKIVKGQIAAAERKNFDKLLAAHIKEHQRLFRRVSLDLGPQRRHASCRPTSAFRIFTTATTRSLPRFTFNLDAIC